MITKYDIFLEYEKNISNRKIKSVSRKKTLKKYKRYIKKLNKILKKGGWKGVVLGGVIEWILGKALDFIFSESDTANNPNSNVNSTPNTNNKTNNSLAKVKAKKSNDRRLTRDIDWGKVGREAPKGAPIDTPGDFDFGSVC